jgi:TRAP-type C4-dicarboxylate transport system substrate-binding protein
MLDTVKPHVLAGVLAAALAVAACGSEDTQRAGGAAQAKSRVLTLANGNGQPDELRIFIDKVHELSKGRLRITPSNGWRSGEEQYEKGLFEDVKSGKADLGWVGSRALDGVGVKAFDPLHAPFLIDSYELQDHVLQGDLTDGMLEALEPAGVTGVAVLPGPMRFLHVDRKIDGPEGLAGLTIALQDSSVGEATLTAFGAQPVEIGSAGSISRLDGVETQISASQGNHYYETAKYTVGDAPLWPRPYVVFADTDAWKALSSEDQRVLRDAGEAARSGMLVETLKGEQKALDTLCRAGGEVVTIGDAGMARLQQAAAPVLEQLRSDPATEQAMSEIEDMRGSAKPQSITCPAGTSRQQAALTGAFATTIRKSEPHSDTVGDFDETGLHAIKLHLKLADGRAVITEEYPEGPSVGFDDSYTTFRDVIKFGGEGGGVPFTARWKVDGNELHFTDISGRADDKYIWGHTWIRER